jgi:predicted N-formylglutamate amidohydrolase
MSPRSEFASASLSPPPLLGPDEPPPLERLPGDAPLLLACDHASRRMPRALGLLGLEERVFDLHVAWDIGAAGVARRLAAMMRAPALLANYSRLAIDLNRGLNQPCLIPESSDGIFIPGNAGLGAVARETRIETLYRPWHRAVAYELRRLDAAAGRMVPLIGIHSFTPQMGGKSRPWQVGVLWDEPCAIARPLMAALAAQGLRVGDNEPYSARNPSGGTLESHALDPGRPGLSLEIRQDLIACEAGQAEWALRLAPLLLDLLCPT